MRCSIDIGSNSTLLLVGEIVGDVINEVVDVATVTGLGKNIDKDSKFVEESMNLTFETLKGYKRIIEKNGLNPSEAIVTATEASRVATNAKDFFAKIKNELGFDITIISSEAEAYYTGRGVSF